MNKFFVFLLLPVFCFAQKNSLKSNLNALTKDKKATVGISVKGINFPFEFNNSHGKEHLPMLSVFKFHIAATVLNEVDQGKFKLNQKVLVKKSDLLENTHSPIRDDYPNGNVELTLDQIIDYTVAKSDNNGCDILLRMLGGTEKVQAFMNSKGVKDFQIKYNEEWMHKGVEYLYPNYSSTQSMSQLLSDFTKGKILSKSSTNYLMKIMLGTSTGTNKLKEQLPKGTLVAHKTGSSGNVGNLTIAENDAGIITLPNGKRYAITVFVKDSNESWETNCKLISDASKVVWDYFNQEQKGLFFHLK